MPTEFEMMMANMHVNQPNNARIIEAELKSRSQFQDMPAKPKWDEYPYSIEKCREYMDYLAIEGITDGAHEKIGGMALCIARYLDELMSIKKHQDHPVNRRGSK